MAGVFDLELEPPNLENDEVSDEEPIEIGEEQVQVLRIFSYSTYGLRRN